MARVTQALLNKGLSKIKTSNVKCYQCLTLPIGSKLILIKSKEIILLNPYITTETKTTTEAFTYAKESAYISTGTELSYNYIIEYNNLIYTLDSSYKHSENGIYHYNLQLVDYNNILIYNNVDEIPENLLYDYSSINKLLNLFISNNIIAMPRNLLINKESLKNKTIFIEIEESNNISALYNKENQYIERIDTVILYYYNYNYDEMFKLIELFYDLIERNEMQIVGNNSIFDIKDTAQYGVNTNLRQYSKFQLYYTIKSREESIKKYIKAISLYLMDTKENINHIVINGVDNENNN